MEGLPVEDLTVENSPSVGVFTEVEATEAGVGTHIATGITTPQPTPMLQPVPVNNGIIINLNLSNNTKSQPKKSENFKITKTFRSLLNPQGRYSTRRTFAAFLGELETNNESQLAAVNHRTGVPFTVRNPTNTMEGSKSTESSTSGRCSCQQISFIRSDREITGSIPNTIPFSILYGPRTEQDTSYFRLQKDQSIHSMSTFQDGRCAHTEGDHRTGRFTHEDRFEGCLRGSANLPGVKTISFLPTPRYSVQIFIASLWVERSASNFFQADAVCNRTIEEVGSSISLLPRRFMFAEQDEERSREDLKHGGSTLREVRFPDQLVQECLDTQQPTRIPRLRVQ
jgi:hypothetical protein